jgi:Domain of unknown function (DUF4105)
MERIDRGDELSSGGFRLNRISRIRLSQLKSSEICLLIVLFCLCSVSARAGVLTAPSEDLEVSLVTFGPGQVYWERFGHNAIRIRDRVSGESGDFNYGVFDFEDGAFLLNFARGHMRYMVDAEHSDVNQQDYIDAGRSVLEQRLALSAEQAGNLRSFLIWNLQPENLTYEYDYLTSNCSTRIRDVLNSVLGGVLKPALAARPAPLTYRQQIDRLMAPEPSMMLPMDLGMGPRTDRPLNEWEESFLPMVLAREIRGVSISDGHGGAEPLVVGEREISPNRLQPPAQSPPNLSWRLGGVGLLLAVVMLVSRSRFPTFFALFGIIYLTLAGLLGTILLALWTLTTHYAAWNNANLLIFNPCAFLLLASVWRSRTGVAASRLARTLIAFQIGAALIGVILHFLPGVAQQNLPWLFFAIPVWLAIMVGRLEVEAELVHRGQAKPHRAS